MPVNPPPVSAILLLWIGLLLTCSILGIAILLTIARLFGYGPYAI
jgi:hypothetical protein